MVIVNLKVRLESLSTTTRQVITHTESPRRFLTCPFYRIRTHHGMPHPSGTLTDPSRNCNQLPLRFTASELPITACPSLLLRKVAYVRFAVTSPSSCSFFRSSIECTRKRLQAPAQFLALNHSLTLPLLRLLLRAPRPNLQPPRAVLRMPSLCPHRLWMVADRLFCRISSLSVPEISRTAP